MGIKRIVDTDFWTDEKVIDLYSPEDKYFMLYLLTNKQTTQLGIYKLPKKIIAFEIGYSNEAITVLLDRFETKYKNIVYNHNTQEIAILNSLKYSIIKGGKPVEDLIVKELSKISDSNLIQRVYDSMLNWWEISQRDFDLIIKGLFEEEILKRKEAKEKINDNDNDNENEESYHDSYHDSLKPLNDNKKPTSIKKSFGELKNVKLTKKEYDKLIYKLGEKKTIEMIDKLSLYISSKGKNYKSHYATVLSWTRNDKEKEVKQPNYEVYRNKVDTEEDMERATKNLEKTLKKFGVNMKEVENGTNN